MRTWLSAIVVVTYTLVATVSNGQSRVDERKLTIPLDTTGVSDWSYMNPSNVRAVESRAVEFENTTSDRTFIVTMPFTLSAAEFNRGFAIARLERDRATLADVVCDAQTTQEGRDVCAAATDELERIEELRVLIESFTAVGDEPPDLVTCDATSAACVVERVYWAAACRLCAAGTRYTFDERQFEFNELLSAEAKKAIDRLILGTAPENVRDLLCDVTQAAVIQKQVIQSEAGVPDCQAVAAATGAVGSLDKAIDAHGEGEAKKRFASERMRIAKAALIAAATEEANDTIQMDRVEAVRNALQAAFDSAEKARNEEAATKVEAAAKLLRSYSPDSPIPFRWRTARDTTRADLRNADLGVSIDDCSATAGAVSCTASATIPPRQKARFSNATLRHSPDDLIRFSVAFFGQTTPPPNSSAFVRLRPPKRGELLVVPPKFSIGLGIDGGSAYDLSSDLGGHNRHTFGTGTTAIGFTGGAVDGSVSLQFKSGDFGNTQAQNVTLSEYQAKVFGPRDFLLQVGQFTFARPSSGIAISERGEGVLFAYRKFAASYIIHRESDAEDGSANPQNDDYYVTLAQMKNVSFQNTRFLDGIDFTIAYGNNKNDDRPKDPEPGPPLPLRKAAYTFTTLGIEARLSFSDVARFSRIRNAAMSAAVYHSRRNVRPRLEESEELNKGRGTVGLLTFGWRWSGNAALFAETRKSRPPYGPTFTVGRGSGDNQGSDVRDEGYLGENAAFAVDKIFLSQLSKNKDFEPTVGRGLENKWYAGVQWADARGSLLGWLASYVGKPESIVSRNTVVALHTYRFANDVHGRRAAGMEANVEFQVESPQKVTWTLGGAYYHRSRAVELAGLEDDVWQITAGVSFKWQGP
jgi:hypothetical protein